MRQQFKSPNNQRIFELFIKVIKDLNQKGVVPIIYGSLGLYLLIGEQGEIDDIDMLIEDQSFLTVIKEVCINNGFTLDPEHVREFIGNNTYISFLDLSDIEKLIGRKLDLKLKIENDVKYNQLSLQDYLEIYTKGLENKDRRDKKENEDHRKINIIQNFLKP